MTDTQPGERATSGLASRVAHELRTPLGVLTTAHGQLAGAAAADPTARRMLEMAERATAQILRIADRLSLLGRAERGFAAGLSVAPTTIEELVAAAVGAVLRSRRRRGVAVEAETGPGGAAQVRVEPALVVFALAELVDNALRFARSRVAVTAVVEDAIVAVRVLDDGPGLDAAAQERFGQRDLRPGRHGGMGVGTALAREIAQAHEGRLYIHRAQDPTEVGLSLPVVRI